MTKSYLVDVIISATVVVEVEDNEGADAAIDVAFDEFPCSIGDKTALHARLVLEKDLVNSERHADAVYLI